MRKTGGRKLCGFAAWREKGIGRDLTLRRKDAKDESFGRTSCLAFLCGDWRDSRADGDVGSDGLRIADGGVRTVGAWKEGKFWIGSLLPVPCSLSLPIVAAWREERIGKGLTQRCKDAK